MNPTKRRTKKFFLLSFSSLTFLLFFCPLPASAGSKTSAKSADKSATSKATDAQQQTPVPSGADEETVRMSFDSFTEEWMGKLAEAEEYHRTQLVKVTQSAEGFSAEYVGYLPQRYIEVKKTVSKETPFVGLLTYYERTLRCSGKKTKEEALKGPFEQVETLPVKEIFRFTKGKWVY